MGQKIWIPIAIVFIECTTINDVNINFNYNRLLKK